MTGWTWSPCEHVDGSTSSVTVSSVSIQGAVCVGMAGRPGRGAAPASEPRKRAAASMKASGVPPNSTVVAHVEHGVARRLVQRLAVVVDLDHVDQALVELEVCDRAAGDGGALADRDGARGEAIVVQLALHRPASPIMSVSKAS